MTTLLHVFTNVIELWFDNIDTYAKKSLLYNDFHVNVRQCPTYKQQFINNANVLRCTNAHYLSQPMFFYTKITLFSGVSPYYNCPKCFRRKLNPFKVNVTYAVLEYTKKKRLSTIHSDQIMFIPSKCMQNIGGRGNYFV